MITRSFSFSNNVFFFRVIKLQAHQNNVAQEYHRKQQATLNFIPLTLFQTNPGFHVYAVQVFLKHCGKRKNCSLRAISAFPPVFSTHLENFQPFSSSQIFICILCQFGGVQNLLFGKGLTNNAQ